MQVDTSQDAQTNLMDLINAKVPGLLTSEGQFEVDSLQTDSDPNDPNANTSGVITAVAGQGLANSAKVFWHRLDPTSIGASKSGPVEVPSDKSSGDVIGLIEQYYGYVPGELEAAVTTPGSRPADTTVTVQTSGSLVYTDGTRDVSVHWD